MRQIRNKDLAQLLMQLRFTPQKQRKRELERAEKLLELVEPAKEYPFEFVCFRITGYAPKGSTRQQLIKGDELAADLGVFISKLSGQVAGAVGEQSQKVYSAEELTAAFGVSTKTIGRWRKRGLLARKFIFDDGKKRLGFLQSAVDKFAKKNPELVAKAKGFVRLTNEEKQFIIKQAAALTARTSLSRYQVINKIAAETGKSHETIRYTLVNYEKANPDKPVSRHPVGVISPAAAAELYKLFKQGSSIDELTRRFGRSKSSIYRIINRRRARALLAKKIEFVTSDEFLAEDARGKIPAEPVVNLKPAYGKSTERFKLDPGSLPQYLQTLKNTPVLNRQREVELFRRYNYLKYLACITRADVKPARASGRRLGEIEDYLAQAEVIKKIIIETNLRLVVSIANKHTRSGANLADLISEGNFSLMRAVEKFDYTRGFRFATYASWVIAKDYARKIPAEIGRPDKPTAASMANIHRDLRIPEVADFAAIERARKNLVQVVRDELDEREQYIILNHFGLPGSIIRKNKKTLKQIGEDLNLSKERVRQIELTALQKLRHSLSIEEFEMLTG